MKNFLELTPWIVAVLSLITAIVNIVCANYDIAIWSGIAFVGWLNAAIYRK